MVFCSVAKQLHESLTRLPIRGGSATGSDGATTDHPCIEREFLLTRRSRSWRRDHSYSILLLPRSRAGVNRFFYPCLIPRLAHTDRHIVSIDCALVRDTREARPDWPAVNRFTCSTCRQTGVGGSDLQDAAANKLLAIHVAGYVMDCTGGWAPVRHVVTNSAG